MGLARLLHRFLVRQTMPSAAISYYDRMSNGVADFYLKPLAEEINRTFSKGARILDVGTGTGHLPVLLAKQNKSYHIMGLDLSRDCIRFAQANAEQNGVSERIRFIQGEVAQLRDTFDLVISTCSLHHWRYPAQMLKNMARLLDDTGQVWLLDDFGDVSEDARKAWIERVEATFDAGILFRTIFRFESRWLAYNERDVRLLCEEAGLQVTDFQVRDVFLLCVSQRCKSS